MSSKPTYEELEQRVRELEEKVTTRQQIQNVIEATNNPIGLVDRSFIYQYANEPYSQALNKPIVEIIGHSVSELFGQNFFETVMRNHYKRCFAGENVVYQAWFDLPGWGRRYMDVRYYPFREADGRITAAVVNAHDITEIKQLEMKLADSEERFRAFMDNNPATIYIKDENDRHIYANPSVLKSVGKKSDEIIGLTTRDIWPPEIADRLIKLDRKIMDGEAPKITEEWSSIEKDDKRWRRDIKFPIKLKSGKKLLGGIAIDITKIKQREEKLQMMQFSIDHALDRIAWISPDGRFLYANKAACKEMGYTLEEVLSMRVSDINSNFPLEHWAEHYKEVKKRGSMLLETQQISGDGQVHGIEVSTNYIKFGDNEFLCSFGRDITERKRAEKKIEELGWFERLLSDISTSFIEISVEKIDQMIIDALEQIGRFLRFDRCSLGSVTPDHKEMLVTHVWHRRPVSGVQQSYNLAHYPWLLSPFITRKELLWNKSDGLPNGSELDIRLLQESGMQSFAGIPVTVVGKLTACLGFSSISEQKVWNSELLQRFNHLSNIFGSAIARKQTEEALLKSQENFRELAGKLLSVQESERRRLAREMHDDLTQRLAVLAIDIGKVERDFQGTKDPVLETLRSIRDRLVNLSIDIHAISRQLHPSIIEDLGLVEAIKSQCHSFTRREGVAVDYQVESVPSKIPTDVAISIYRIIQEGLRNVAKHSGTTQLQISLTGKDDSILLTIKDQGTGFDPKVAEKKRGLGLVSMQERVRLIQGDISIESQPGKGTVITVRAPL